MSDAGRLYQATVKNLFDLFPEMLEDNVVTLAMMVTGILRAQSGQLAKIARKVSYSKKKVVW